MSTLPHTLNRTKNVCSCFLLRESRSDPAMPLGRLFGIMPMALRTDANDLIRRLHIRFH